ncbi:MAG: HEAT repeat domain-containing protein [candidate division WOR-3 bacterium]|uniref:HEAT repeat domain-containing protein n=1 Tax=candidate division WOR-3 bacterium TaxID=2052148 RepID=A0A7C1NAI5_UNCW3|nr:HEAT repeat domain-containing protein [candidate division WOR-3 bacterium]
MIRITGLLLIFAALGFAVQPPEYGLDSVARGALNDALVIQGMQEQELGFFKFWAVDSFFRLKVVERLLSRPLEVLPYVEGQGRFVQEHCRNQAGLVRHLYNEIDVRLERRDSTRLAAEINAELKRKSASAGVEGVVNIITAGFAVGKRYLDRALAKVPGHELDILLGEAPGFWRDEGDTLERSFSGRLHQEFGRVYDTSRQVKSETLLAYARKIDRRALALSGLAVVSAVQRALEILKTAPGESLPAISVAGVRGEVVYYQESEWGRIIVGGDGDNVYETPAAVIVDLGGNDIYYNRAGGAVGILDYPFGVVIDLKGDDHYLSDRLFSQGSALFGCGVLFDLAGDDVYRGNHYTQGSAIFGTGLLYDAAGKDIYDAGFFAQGSGHYGVGVLIDEGGNDSYRSFCYCQGFAGTWGYGLLAELAGNDLYYAGGKYKHEPLLPREYRSFAQGYAIGVRPDAGGGIGFLCDFQGNDFYNAEVYAQGTSYWYSLGMLYDQEGFDHYTAAQYTQGAGIHLSVGALVDEEGNDSYFSRLGPSQGEGHDLSVGVLVDRKGDDGYYASGGQGIGLTNSVGLFIDQDGNDWYMASESLICQGSSNWARGFGGIGLFLDLAGRDWYPGRNVAADQNRWTKGTYGSGIDLPRPATVIDWEPDVDTSEASIDSVITAPVESVFKTASIWAVGNARKKVLRARKELIRLGRMAVEYVYEHKLDTKDGLESEAITALMKALPDTAKPYLFRGLRDERFLARQNSAYWLGEMGSNARDAVDSILLALKEKRITPRRAVYALGSIGDSLVVPQILYLLKDTMEVSRIVTAEACGKLKNPVAIEPLIATLNDRLFTVRSAAEAALVAIGEPGVDPLLRSLAEQKEPALGHSIRALGQIAAKLDSVHAEPVKQKCRNRLVSCLRHPAPFVRLCTVEALGRMLDSETEARLRAEKEKETDLFVLNAYRQILNRSLH